MEIQTGRGSVSHLRLHVRQEAEAAEERKKVTATPKYIVQPLSCRLGHMICPPYTPLSVYLFSAQVGSCQPTCAPTQITAHLTQTLTNGLPVHARTF